MLFTHLLTHPMCTFPRYSQELRICKSWTCIPKTQSLIVLLNLFVASTVSERRRGQYLGHRLLGGKQQGHCPPGPLRISLSLFTRRQDPSLLFGPYNWNPPSGSKEYCSWDGPNKKVCNHHQYDKGLISLVHNAGAEIYPSLGGWTLSDPFPAMSASAPARARFAENCVDLIKEYGFDGIDIDWEVSNKMAFA